MIHTVKDFHTVNEAEIDVLLEFTCFLYDPTNVKSCQIDLWFLCLFYIQVVHLEFSAVNVLLMPSLKDFEDYLDSI